MQVMVRGNALMSTGSACQACLIRGRYLLPPSPAQWVVCQTSPPPTPIAPISLANACRIDILVSLDCIQPYLCISTIHSAHRNRQSREGVAADQHCERRVRGLYRSDVTFLRRLGLTRKGKGIYASDIVTPDDIFISTFLIDKSPPTLGPRLICFGGFVSIVAHSKPKQGAPVSLRYTAYTAPSC